MMDYGKQAGKKKIPSEKKEEIAIEKTKKLQRRNETSEQKVGGRGNLKRKRYVFRTKNQT